MKKRILIIFFGVMFSQDTLYFVYNAQSDMFSFMGDFIHKTFSPKTYPCKLCDLSYGVFSKKKVWRNFLDSLNINYEFIYKDQIDNFSQKIDSFPIILIGEKNNISVLLSKKDINNTKNIESLIEKIKIELKNEGLG